MITAMAAAAAASTLPLSPAPRADEKSETLPLLKPRRLQPGMTVGLIAPASPPSEPERVRYAIEVVESLGFRVKEGEHLWQRTQYLAGPDRLRAADVNWAFGDPEVEAIFCLRGGYGTMRTLPYLDYDLIARNPKIITGFSDITGIINPIHARTGLVTFHGPVGEQTFSDYTLEEYKKVMVNPSAPVTIASPPPFETGEGKVELENRITRFVGGKAQG